MNCSECKAHISEFLDGELSELSSTIVRKHLLSCSDCQRLADEFSSLSFEIEQAMDSIQVPVDLEERILTSIRLEHNTASKQVWLTGLTLILLGIPILALFYSFFLGSLRLVYKTSSVLIHTWLTLITIAVPPMLGLGITLVVTLVAALGVYSLRALLKGFQVNEVLL
ncbi:MAG: zf-HC2 domain-containing protein [Desulfosporosinus sp.]|nr:zf-HC2 domain-containing protein [Desulfosporosinus sp.]